MKLSMKCIINYLIIIITFAVSIILYEILKWILITYFQWYKFIIFLNQFVNILLVCRIVFVTCFVYMLIKNWNKMLQTTLRALLIKNCTP